MYLLVSYLWGSYEHINVVLRTYVPVSPLLGGELCATHLLSSYAFVYIYAATMALGMYCLVCTYVPMHICMSVCSGM